MSTTLYSGMVFESGAVSVRVRRGSVGRALPMTFGYARTLPARFRWGDRSLASLHLAHAVLAHAVGWRIADRLAPDFLESVVSRWDVLLFIVSKESVEAWVTGWIYAAGEVAHEIDGQHKRVARGGEASNEQ